jgi:hypothetical protein
MEVHHIRAPRKPQKAKQRRYVTGSQASMPREWMQPDGFALTETAPQEGSSWAGNVNRPPTLNSTLCDTQRLARRPTGQGLADHQETLTSLGAAAAALLDHVEDAHSCE